MKIYDKASWHIDGGEYKKEVIDKFRIILRCLKRKEYLTPYGEEILEIVEDESISLNEKMVNDKGKAFLDRYYNEIINLSAEDVREVLKNISES